MGAGLVSSSIMIELSVSDSFIVRIYRIDTENPSKLTGLVEIMDGSGERAPFTNLEELASILCSGWPNGAAGAKQRHCSRRNL